MKNQLETLKLLVPSLENSIDQLQMVYGTITQKLSKDSQQSFDSRIKRLIDELGDTNSIPNLVSSQLDEIKKIEKRVATLQQLGLDPNAALSTLEAKKAKLQKEIQTFPFKDGKQKDFCDQVKAVQQQVDSLPILLSAVGKGMRQAEKQALEEWVYNCNTPELKKIIDLLGKLKDFPKAKTSKKPSTATGVTLSHGSDIGLVSASEIASPFFYKNFVEGSLLQNSESKKQNRGNIYCLVDVSRSMEADDRLNWAKAICLYLLQVKAKTKRRLFVSVFSTTAFPWKEIKPDKESIQWILSIVAHGGTDITTAIRFGYKALQKDKKGGLLLVSDCEDDYQGTRENENDCRPKDSTFNAILVGNSPRESVLQLPDKKLSVKHLGKLTKAQKKTTKALIDNI